MARRTQDDHGLPSRSRTAPASGGFAVRPAGGDRRRMLVGWALACLVAVAGVLLLEAATGVSVRHLHADPGQVGGMSPWVGSLSMLALVAWTVAAVALLLAGAVSRVAERPARRREWLVVTGALTLGLLLDDALQLHEDVLPSALGAEDGDTTIEMALYSVHVVVLAVWARRYRDQLREVDLLLVLAFAAFALSLSFEVVPEVIAPVGSLLEEAPAATAALEETAEMVGIGSFAAFGVRAFRTELAALAALAARRTAADREPATVGS